MLRELEKVDPDVSEFINGNDRAFSSIYKKYYDGIRKLVKSRIIDIEIVEEITQEIFLKVFRFRKAYDGRHAFSTWLWAIAKNSIFDHLRSSRQRELVSHRTSDISFSIEELPCGRETAEGLLLKKDQRRVLLCMMKNLSRLQRRVLWFRLVHHLSYNEIARRLGVSVSAVRNMAFRAKITLNLASH